METYALWMHAFTGMHACACMHSCMHAIVCIPMNLHGHAYSMGGEIFIPKLKSYKIVDLVKAISGSGKIKDIGIRQGEKIYEELISKGETADIFSYKDFYIISSQTKINLKGDYKKIEKNFSYNSNNSGFYNVNELKKIISGELKII